MLVTAALSLKRVGTRSQSPGTMVMWPSCNMATCAKSSERSPAALFDGEVTVHDSRCAGHSDAAAQRGKDARKFISPLTSERTALRRLRRQCRGTNSVVLTFLECVAGAISHQMLDCRCAAYFDVYQTRTTTAHAALAHGSRSGLRRTDRSHRFRGNSFLVGIGERKSPAHISGGAELQA